MVSVQMFLRDVLALWGGFFGLASCVVCKEMIWLILLAVEQTLGGNRTRLHCTRGMPLSLLTNFKL